MNQTNSPSSPNTSESDQRFTTGFHCLRHWAILDAQEEHQVSKNQESLWPSYPWHSLLASGLWGTVGGKIEYLC